MTDELRTLLTDVAEGRVAPEEAARRLSSPSGGAEAPSTATTDDAESPHATAGPDQTARPSATLPQPAVRLVRVQSSARPVRVYADPAVDTLVVDGPHDVLRDGDTLRVVAPPSDQAPGDGSFRYEARSAWSRWLQHAQMVGVPLTVRVNPALAVEADVMAGSLDVQGLRGTFGFTVTAGSLKVEDCSGPLRGQIRAGSARIEARPTFGESSVRLESGSLVLRLLRGSDVRVRTRCELGEIKFDGVTRGGTTGEGQERVVGDGTATFDLDVTMGSAKVTTP
jgi:hypothetical protein